MLSHQAPADQAAPVLPDDGQAVQVKMIGRDRTQPGVREHRHDLPVQKRPARLTVQQQHRLTVGRPGLREG
jgi:hypothetical protein